MQTSEHISASANQTPENWRLWALLLSASVLLAILCVLFPRLDIEIARQFYRLDGRFAGEMSSIAVFLRQAFITVYLGGCLFSIAGVWLTRCGTRFFLRLGLSHWLFLVVCLGAGPGVVANLALKDHSGRARPREIVEFGGAQKFSTATTPANECTRNCSFVCGESSSMFAVFFAGACVWRRNSKLLIAAGIAAGGAAGLVRMSQGAHFFSDVVFSGLFMAATVFAIYWLFDAIAASAPNRRS